MSVSENVKLGMLIDTYGELLSQKQKQIILDAVNNDMSLGEIAEEKGITRSAVLDALSTAKRKLLVYENALKLCEIKTRLINATKLDDKNCKDEIKKLLEEL